jgi:hypothetical protein
VTYPQLTRHMHFFALHPYTPLPFNSLSNTFRARVTMARPARARSGNGSAGNSSNAGSCGANGRQRARKAGEFVGAATLGLAAGSSVTNLAIHMAAAAGTKGAATLTSGLATLGGGSIAAGGGGMVAGQAVTHAIVAAGAIGKPGDA